MFDQNFIDKLAVEASVLLYDPIDRDNSSYIYEWYPDMLKFLSKHKNSKFLIEGDKQTTSIELSKFMYGQTGQSSSIEAYDKLADLISSRIENYKTSQFEI